MPLPKIDAIYYHAQLRLQEKGRAIKNWQLPAYWLGFRAFGPAKRSIPMLLSTNP